MAVTRVSEWPVLFDLATEVVARAKAAIQSEIDWSFGGGTALMLKIDHRESHDIDFFLDDPQLLAFLNPGTQGYPLSRHPDSYGGDGTLSLRLVYKEGEIDFICCAPITENPAKLKPVRGQSVALETPAEIIAKKVYYRGASLQPRDMFDLAAVAESFGAEYVIAALKQCGPSPCSTALRSASRADAEFVKKIISQLMYREHTAHLIDKAQGITCELLDRALSGA